MKGDIKVTLRVPFDQAEKDPRESQDMEPDMEIHISTQITIYIPGLTMVNIHSRLSLKTQT